MRVHRKFFVSYENIFFFFYFRGLCHNGRCITNYCKMLGLLDNRFYRPCMCEHNGESFISAEIIYFRYFVEDWC